MEFIELNATKRTVSGKGAARQLRRSRQIPAILYGKDIDPELLSLSIKDLDIVFRKHGSARLFFNLKIDGDAKERKALLKELQVDTVTGEYIHMDLHQIALDKSLRITVPLETVGTSKGVEAGGLLQIVRRELEVICLPQNIPSNIEVDVSDLNIGDSIHVSELNLPEGVVAPYDVDFTMITVVQPKSQETEETEESEEEGEEGTEEQEKDKDKDKDKKDKDK